MKLLKMSHRVANIILPLIYITLLLFVAALMEGCADKCTDVQSYIYYEPQYISLEDLRSSVKTGEIREIINPGKIYYLNGYILINQPGEGIHVVNNRDNKNPELVSFIEVPGNFDLAGKGNYLFVDSYIDLVVLDFSDFDNVVEKTRINNFFPNYNNHGYTLDPEKGLVTHWEEVKTVEELTIDCESGYYYGWKNYRSGILVASFDMAFSMELSSVRSAAPQNPGIGGSLARFTITGDFLFTVDESQLQSVDISNPLTPLLGSKQTVAWGLETIFPYGDKLYIGANTGMHIFSVADPHNPEFMTTFSHVRSCDPVVVEGDYAYVTLRGGTNCRVAGTNQLDVLNIADPLNVKLIKSYALTNPGGLGIDNDILFICDGDAGLKIFDATDKLTISANKLAQYPDVKAIDVIPFNKVLMVIAKDGFYQYDYSDITNISLLSQIPVTFEL